MLPVTAFKVLTDQGAKKKLRNNPAHLLKLGVRQETANTGSDTQLMNCSLSLPPKIKTSEVKTWMGKHVNDV